MFQTSYDEVLAALKHQDDKLNRTLTAIAFLTAAGVAIFANLSTKAKIPYFAGESSIAVTTFFFAVFLGSVVFALVFALAAIGPSDALPRIWKRGTRSRDTWPSLLFYAQILNDGDWPKYIERDEAWLRECLARNYHNEAFTLSQRIEYKVARSRESGAYVQLAILSLSLLGIFSITQMSLGTRWWVATGLLAAILATPLWDAFLMRKWEFKTASQMEERRLTYAAVWIAAASGIALLATAPHWHSHWWALSYALGAILALRLAVALTKLRRITSILITTVAAVGPILILTAWLS